MERTVEIVPEAGLHARPASKFVQTVNDHDADVEVGRADGEELVAGNSMLAVTGLNAKQGDRIHIVAEGADTEAVLDALEAILTSPVEEE